LFDLICFVLFCFLVQSKRVDAISYL
jgi:hypothetical protein